MLTQAEIAEYTWSGALVVPDVLDAEALWDLRGAIEALAGRDGGAMQARRGEACHLLHPAFRRLVRHPRIVSVLQALWGPNVRFDTATLVRDPARSRAPTEWRQDWAASPHTNDDQARVGVLLDDVTPEDSPLLVVPGTHRGPVFDHHCDGRFCGAMDPANHEVDFASAIPLAGRAGSITLHHARLVHGVVGNASGRDRWGLSLRYRAADAWPLLGAPEGYQGYESLMVAGVSSLQPRLVPVPVRLPWPAAAHAPMP
jgi:hypothetical protein